MNTPHCQSGSDLEKELLTRMLLGDLDIARRMAQVGDLAMCRNALESAAAKVRQIQNLPVPLVPEFSEAEPEPEPIDIKVITT